MKCASSSNASKFKPYQITTFLLIFFCLLNVSYGLSNATRIFQVKLQNPQLYQITTFLLLFFCLPNEQTVFPTQCAFVKWTFNFTALSNHKPIIFILLIFFLLSLYCTVQAAFQVQGNPSKLPFSCNLATPCAPLG